MTIGYGCLVQQKVWICFSFIYIDVTFMEVLVPAHDLFILILFYSNDGHLLFALSK